MDPRQRALVPQYTRLTNAPLGAPATPAMQHQDHFTPYTPYTPFAQAMPYSQYSQPAGQSSSRPLTVPPSAMPRYAPLGKQNAPSLPPDLQSQMFAKKSPKTIPHANVRAVPKPDERYIMQAQNKPFARMTPKKMLVILDLNGTLVVRNRNKRTFVKRPFLDQFLKSLFSNHRVLVWSSAQPESVNAMVKGIMSPQQIKDLVSIWDRTSLRLTPAQYKEKVQVFKQLTWVWDNKLVESSAETMWDQTNTVLIDDSYLKASSEPFNHIEVPEFDAGMVELEETKSPVLRELLRYLEEASYFEDVSTFIRSHRFKMPGVIQGAGAPSVTLPGLETIGQVPQDSY